MKILAVALNNIRIFSRDRAGWAWSLVLPIVFTVVVNLAFGSQSGEGSETGAQVPRAKVAWVDEDASRASAILRQALEQEAGLQILPVGDRAQAEAQIRERKVSWAIVVPQGLKAKLFQGERAEIVLMEPPENTNPLVNEGALRAARHLEGLNLAAAFALKQERELRSGGGGPSGKAAVPDLAAWELALRFADSEWQRDPPLTVTYSEVDSLAKEVHPQGWDMGTQSSVGFMVMFVMMATFAHTSSILEEKRQGTWARLLSTPTSPTSILAGKLLGIYAQGLIQVAVLVAFSALVFKVSWGRSPLATGLVLLAYLAATVGLALLVAAWSRSLAQASYLGIFLTIVTSMLGGAWWPLEIMPATMQKVALAVPAGWAMRGLLDAIIRGADLMTVFPSAGALLGMAAVFFLGGMRAFRAGA